MSTGSWFATTEFHSLIPLAFTRSMQKRDQFLSATPPLPKPPHGDRHFTTRQRRSDVRRRFGQLGGAVSDFNSTLRTRCLCHETITIVRHLGKRSYQLTRRRRTTGLLLCSSIARMCFPNAEAIGGGTALPTCLAQDQRLPTNSYDAGNP